MDLRVPNTRTESADSNIIVTNYQNTTEKLPYNQALKPTKSATVSSVANAMSRCYIESVSRFLRLSFIVIRLNHNDI
ncbi:hypothetical protein MJD09_27565, partial [bacterium]|nr:hypothetical protein [bacterium]